MPVMGLRLRLLAIEVAVLAITLGIGLGILMTRGHHDWFINTSSYGEFGVDTAELAARLGSPDTMLRSGRVIFEDDFERGVDAFDLFPAGASSELVLNSTNPFSGAEALRVTVNPAGDNADRIEKSFPNVSNRKWGQEVMVWLVRQDDKFEVRIRHYTGGTLYTYAIRVDNANNELQVATGENMWEKVATLPELYSMSRYYHIVKLVGDLENHKLVRAYVDEFSYDLSAYSAVSAAESATPPSVRIRLRFYTVTSTLESFYIDRWITTVDEP